MITTLLTISEAAAAIGRRRGFIEARIREGAIPVARIGGRRYVREADLQAWIDRITRTADRRPIATMPRKII